MPTTISTFATGEATMRYKEPYVTEGLNKKIAVVNPPGIYRGFRLGTSGSALSVSVQATADATNDHVAVYQTISGPALTIRKTAAIPDINLVAYINKTVVIAIYATYGVGFTTTAELRVYELLPTDEFTGAPERPELVVLGTVVVPAAGLIGFDSITTLHHRAAWENQATESVQWAPLLKNGAFEYAPTAGYAATTKPFYIPEWVALTGVDNAQWRASTASPRTGSRCLTLEVLSIGTWSPGLLQQIGIPVVQARRMRVRLWKQNLIVPASGTLNLQFRFLNTASGSTQPVASVVNVNIPVTAVDAGYVEIDRTFSIPVSGPLATVLFTGSALDYGSTGVALRIDDMQIWMEVPTATERQQPIKPSARARHLVLEGAEGLDSASALLLQILNNADLVLSRIDEDATATAQPSIDLSRIKNLGKNLLDTEAKALQPRITADVATAANINFTLLWESTPGALKVLRIYGGDLDNATVTQPGIFMTVNARFDGTNWVKDVNGVASIGLYLTANPSTTGFWRFYTQTSPDSWLPAAWEKNTSLGYNSSTLEMRLENIVGAINRASLFLTKLTLNENSDSSVSNSMFDIGLGLQRRSPVWITGVNDVVGVDHMDQHGMFFRSGLVVEEDFNAGSGLGTFVQQDFLGAGTITNGASRITITTGGALNNHTIARHTNLNFFDTNAGSLSVGFKARIRASDVTNAEQRFGFWLDEGNNPDTDGVMTGFKIINGVVSIIWHDGGGQHVIATGITVTSGESRWYGFVFDPVNGIIQWHISTSGANAIDGYTASAYYSEQAADDLLAVDPGGLFFGVKTTTAATASGVVDYISGWLNSRYAL